MVIPGKNGLELTRLFKTDVRTAHIPVIRFTARSGENQKIEGLKTGADAYVIKPFNFTLLDQQINSLLLNRFKSKEHYSSEIFQVVLRPLIFLQYLKQNCLKRHLILKKG